MIRLLQNFGSEVLLYDPFVSSKQAGELGAVKVELPEIAAAADVISLHAPATNQTHCMINEDFMKLMKDDALLINTARGSLIDEPALIRELSKGRFFAYLDVTDPEPPAADSPLRTLPNVVVLPHIAGCIENCGRMGEMAVRELKRFFEGKPPICRITQEMLQRIG